MGLNIFEVTKDNAEAAPSDAMAGRFRSGYQTSDGRPVGLSAFRVTTETQEMAEEVGKLLGQKEAPGQWETTTSQDWEVFTEASEVEVIVDGPGAVRASLVLWGQNGKILETDGTYLYGDDGRITTEVCTMTQGKTLPELKAAARAGKGPGPSLQAYFRLAGAPGLGKFAFFSSAWTALEAFGEVADLLETLEGPQLFRLALEKVEFTNKDGENISFTKPTLTHLGAAEEAF